MGKLFAADKKGKKLLTIILVAFVAIFLLRWGYEVYFSRNDIYISYGDVNNSYYNSGITEIDDGYRFKSNVASAKINQYDISGKQVVIDQKYEKTADISANSDTFASHKEQINALIKETEAVIQTENLTGLSGSQRLYMEIGVLPNKFDELVEKVKEIGYLDSFAVNKVDKTSEFRALMAEQKTLEKTRASYTEIKANGGTIEELLLLETKILEVEKSLQTLSVDLGVFSTENSFCTVKFSLKETESRSISVRFVLSCGKDSFFWTLTAFLVAGALFLALLIFVSITLFLLNSIRNSNTRKDGTEAKSLGGYEPYDPGEFSNPKNAGNEKKDEKSK